MPSPATIRLLFVAAALVTVACTKPATPEQRVREFLSRAEQAAENKDVRTLRSYVSQQYSDADGRDRRAIEAILRIQVLGHESIHLLTRIERIEFPALGRAEVGIYAAMAGRPPVDSAELSPIRANVYRFQLTLADEDSEWRVLHAQWQPAQPSDLIR
jgi:hypothetical protein